MARVRRIFCGKRRGFIVEHVFENAAVKVIVEDSSVEVDEGPRLVSLETFFNPPRDDAYRFIIECASSPLVILEGKNLEVSKASDKEYKTESVHLRNTAFYRLKLLIPRPIPSTTISMWISYGNVIDIAAPHCYVPSSNFVTIVNVPEGFVELRNIGTIASAKSCRGIAQLDLSNVKQPVEGKLFVNGVELAKLSDVWGGDVYTLNL